MGVNLSALVAPFAGERYATTVALSEVISPPYDVISPDQRAALAQRNPHNVVHVILPEGDGDRYERAARRLREWRAQRVLVQDPEPALYVVRQRVATPDGASHQRTGVIAAVSAEPFAAGRVRPHERTHEGPKQDRLALLRATETMCEALLVLTRDPTGAVRAALAQAVASRPLVQGEMGGVEVALWRVTGAPVGALAAAAGVPPLYIADGHHRYETAVAYRGENPRAPRTLALIVPLGDPGLVVLPTHRLVSGEPLAADALRERLAAHFSLDRIGHDRGDVGRALDDVRRRGGGCVLVLERGEAYRLLRVPGPAPEPLAALDPAVRSLDVAWADALVVSALQGVSGPASLGYTPELGTALERVERREARAAVLLNPPAVEQVLAVADAGAVMPPKATFFTPKVPSGLVLLNCAVPASPRHPESL